MRADGAHAGSDVAMQQVCDREVDEIGLFPVRCGPLAVAQRRQKARAKAAVVGT